MCRDRGDFTHRGAETRDRAEGVRGENFSGAGFRIDWFTCGFTLVWAEISGAANVSFFTGNDVTAFLQCHAVAEVHVVPAFIWFKIHAVYGTEKNRSFVRNHRPAA